ncbi:uncharacterized protein LOC116298850 [Actinia tenebrosa]|uniref:Uncharacterized protein LOC116298850 n=1 Tax=Actinia tenebrosa TaxID=6105 RepID=A0A6P8ID77_ACTTE|nr:uncharacterized protein LOC116298850 [Actinia tenebrosa]
MNFNMNPAQEKQSGSKDATDIRQGPKKTRKVKTRSSRGKKVQTDRTNSRFGIRYLHHHMFEEGTPESKQPCPSVECKCGSGMAAVYSAKTLIALTCSILILLIGVTFMLVGYVIPRRPVVYIERGDGSRIPVDKTALTFNTMLDDFTLVGTVLISIGALLFCVVLLLPVCRATNRRGDYRKAPTEEAPVRREMSMDSLSSSNQTDSLERRSSSGATSSSSSIQKIPVLALVHNVQQREPQRSPSNIHEYRLAANKHKDSFEEEN